MLKGTPLPSHILRLAVLAASLVSSYTAAGIILHIFTAILIARQETRHPEKHIAEQNPSNLLIIRTEEMTCQRFGKEYDAMHSRIHNPA